MRSVFFVFKTIFFTIISLFMIDVVFTLVSIFQLNDEIEATAKMMEQNIMEENYLTEDAKEVYTAIFNGGTPNISGYTGDAYQGITHDNGNGVRVAGADGISGEGIQASRVSFSIKDSTGNEVTEPQKYGEFLKLNIGVTVRPSMFWFQGKLDDPDNARSWYLVNINKEYAVPCLRYVK